MDSERLDKFIASQTPFSRKDVKKLIKNGRVTVDNSRAIDSEMKIIAQENVICIDSRPVGYRKNIYIMMNKPKGVLSVSSDNKSQTAVELIKGDLFREGLFPAGRLDKDSTGFLLITDDGDFAHKILSPKSHVPKAYTVIMDALPSGNAEKAFSEGITLADGNKCLSAEYKLINNNPPTAEITLHEGMYHQIKRMLGTLDTGVCELHRTKIGGLYLDENLKSGEYREITENEIKMIVNIN